MSDPTPARLLDGNPEGAPFFRLSSEMIPKGLALIADKHRGVPGELTSENLDTFEVSEGTKMEFVVKQFSSKHAANGSILDFCFRYDDVIISLFSDEVKIICAPATTFAERNKVPERPFVLGLKLREAEPKKGEGRLQYTWLRYDQAPPEGTCVLLLK